MAQQQKVGSETMGSPEKSSSMTLFKDDRQEDWGAIIFAVIVVAIIIVMTLK